MKYTGDSLLGVSFEMQTPKPLDNRLVIDTKKELYEINPNTAYEGMLVTCIADGFTYMLKDKSKINSSDGWKSVAIQIVSLTKAEFDQRKENTNSDYTPIDDKIPYLDKDVYYYIYEDSISEVGEFYVTQDQFNQLNELIGLKADTSALNTFKQETKDKFDSLSNKYVPLSFLDSPGEGTLSATLASYYTKQEADGKFLTRENFGGDTADLSFVKTNDYTSTIGTINQELANKIDSRSDAELSSLKTNTIELNNKQIKVQSEGLYFGGKRLAEIEEVPDWICIPHQQYLQMLNDGKLEEGKYYLTYGDEIDDSGYITMTNLEQKYMSVRNAETIIDELVRNKINSLIRVDDNGVLVVS